MAVQITPFTKTPSRQNPATFSSDMDTRLSEENSRITEMNAMSDEMDARSYDIDVKYSDILNKHTQISEDASMTQIYRNDAVSAKEAIDGYVIPSDATYSPEAIDAKIQNTRLESFLGFNF